MESSYQSAHEFFGIERPKYPIFLEQCKTPIQNKEFREIINKFHSYKIYRNSPCRNLRWLVFESESGNNVGAIGLSSAALAVSCRDKFIGWDKATKIRNLNKVASNSRFCLIRKNITVKNAASMTLKQLRIIGAKDWKSRYGDELILIETYIEAERDKELDGHLLRNGACYKADNWIEIGMTVGASIQKSPLSLWKKENSNRGEMARKDPKKALKIYGAYLENGGKQYKVTASQKKIVLVKPLVSNWKELLLA